jgi:thiol:disulfide interchange protein DsbD
MGSSRAGKGGFRGYALLAVIALAIAASPRAAMAQALQAKHLEAELVAENDAIHPNEPFMVALRLKMEEGWHTYWRNPGDAGMATSIEWQLPEGFTAGPILWPIPQRIGEAPEVSYGYGGEVLLMTQITPPGNISDGREITLTANVSWLVCKELCIPGKGTLTLKLPVTSSPTKLAALWHDAFARAWSSLPSSSKSWETQALLRGDTIHLYLKLGDEGMGGFPANPDSLYFFAADPEVIDHSAPQIARWSPRGAEILLPRSQYWNSPPGRLRGILTAPFVWVTPTHTSSTYADASRALWVDVALPSSSDER